MGCLVVPSILEYSSISASICYDVVRQTSLVLLSNVSTAGCGVRCWQIISWELKIFWSSVPRCFWQGQGIGDKGLAKIEVFIHYSFLCRLSCSWCIRSVRYATSRAILLCLWQQRAARGPVIDNACSERRSNIFSFVVFQSMLSRFYAFSKVLIFMLYRIVQACVQLVVLQDMFDCCVIHFVFVPHLHSCTSIFLPVTSISVTVSTFETIIDFLIFLVSISDFSLTTWKASRFIFFSILWQVHSFNSCASFPKCIERICWGCVSQFMPTVCYVRSHWAAAQWDCNETPVVLLLLLRATEPGLGNMRIQANWQLKLTLLLTAWLLNLLQASLLPASIVGRLYVFFEHPYQC